MHSLDPNFATFYEFKIRVNFKKNFNIKLIKFLNSIFPKLKEILNQILEEN